LIFGAKFLTLANVDEKKVMPYDDFWVFHSLHNFEVLLGGKKGEKFHHLEILKGSQN
jgi:hypothetical protein